MASFRFALGLLLFLWSSAIRAEDPAADPAPFQAYLKHDPALWITPQVYPADTPSEAGLEGFYYEGPRFQGQETRVFAWLGMPGPEVPRPVPGVVLIHGGGGTAFAEYVRAWNSHGYAAVAMDLEGHLPTRTQTPEGKAVWPKHPFSGPERSGIFDDAAQPLGDQWPYHALCAIFRARALLAAHEGVDPRWIGYTGFSWGGILTILAAGLDKRASFAAPIYGCGFLQEGDTSVGQAIVKKTGAALERSLHWWEPSNYLAQIKAPSLWVNGSNDAHFPLEIWDKSIRAISAPVWRSIHLRMPHGGKPAFDAAEPYAFADALRGKRPPFPNWREVSLRGRTVSAEAPAGTNRNLTLAYTKDSWPTEKRNWETVLLEAKSGPLQVEAPAGARLLYLSATTADGLLISSELISVPPP